MAHLPRIGLYGLILLAGATVGKEGYPHPIATTSHAMAAAGGRAGGVLR